MIQDNDKAKNQAFTGSKWSTSNFNAFQNKTQHILEKDGIIQSLKYTIHNSQSSKFLKDTKQWKKCGP